MSDETNNSASPFSPDDEGPDFVTHSHTDHDAMDEALNATGLNSIFQRVRRLTPKHREVLEFVLKGMDPREACRRAGFKNAAAMNKIREAVPDIMERAGLHEAALIGTYLVPLLEAQTTKFFNGKEGLIETQARPALDIRLNALRMAFDLHGSFAKAEDEAPTNVDSHDINVNIIHVGEK